MAIYVQSRGKTQDNDYRWLKITSDSYKPENPDFLTQIIPNSTNKPIDLIESQKFSIILIGLRNDYVLLITGLKAQATRTDFAGRQIRNSLLWICHKNSEVQVRSLLIRALQGELDSAIDRTIDSDREYGFKVDYQLFKQLSNSTLALANNQNTDVNCKIGHNNQLLRQELALELQNNPLPNREGLLILITSLKSASALTQTGVWRGLSNRVENQEWESYSLIKQSQKKTVLLRIAIALIVIIAIALLTLQYTTFQKLKPEIIPTPSTNQKNLSTTLNKKLNLSVNLININETNYLIFSPIFKKG